MGILGKRRRKPTNRLLVVNRDNFRLVLYERPLLSYKLELTRRYEIAVGKDGYRTPKGIFLINSRAKDPEWKMPDSEWVPEDLRGQIVPGGDPNNPLVARWLGVTDPEDGIGIHGTRDLGSLGGRASHGCIRMRPDDLIELYPLVPYYTPVVIL